MRLLNAAWCDFAADCEFRMTSSHPTNAEKNRKLPWALGGWALNTVFLHLVVTGPVFLLFLDHLKLDKSQIGMLLSLLPLGGFIAILVGMKASKVGVKRVYLVSWTLRKLVMIGLIFAPWVVWTWGAQAGFWYIAGVIGLFAICRSVGESSILIWQHEYIPAGRRGRYTATELVAKTIAGALAVALAGWLLKQNPGTVSFQIIFALGIAAGLAGMFCFFQLPGGAPAQPVSREKAAPREWLVPLRDRRFVRAIIANTLLNLGWLMTLCFLPLFYRDHLGLREDQVVTLQAVMMVSQLATCFLWGWMADRYGGQPQTVIAAGLMAVFPLAMMLIPRHGELILPLLVGVLLFQGMIAPALDIGNARMLNVDLIPAQGKAGYMIILFAEGLLTAGLSPLLAGLMLEHLPHYQGSLGWLHVDPYTPLFAICILFMLASAGVYASIAIHDSMPVRSFPGLFMQGNPLAAMQAIFFHQFAGQERSRIASVKRLGRINSPLGVEELVSALQDPSSNIRHEAIIAIAAMRRHPRLTQAMVRTLAQGPPALRAAAAWALGRMGDPQALPALRQALDDPSPLLRSHAARSLGAMGDHAAIPRIVELFHAESDAHQAVGYASALAAMGQQQMIPPMLHFLRETQDADVRQETALAIASLLGADAQAMRLWRRMIARPGDTLGAILMSLRKRLAPSDATPSAAEALTQGIDRCARWLEMEDFEQGACEFKLILTQVAGQTSSPAVVAVLSEAASALNEFGCQRIEYLFLAIYALHLGTPRTAFGRMSA